MDLGEVEPGGLEPALDAIEAFEERPRWSLAASIELDANLEALTPQRHELRTEAVEALDKRERQRRRWSLDQERLGHRTSMSTIPVAEELGVRPL
jgi:hypothetical protein